MRHSGDRSRTSKPRARILTNRAKLVLEWKYTDSSQDDTPRLDDLLAKAGLSMRDVEERMQHYENASTHSSETHRSVSRLFQ